MFCRIDLRLRPEEEFVGLLVGVIEACGTSRENVLAIMFVRAIACACAPTYVYVNDLNIPCIFEICSSSALSSLRDYRKEINQDLCKGLGSFGFAGQGPQCLNLIKTDSRLRSSVTSSMIPVNKTGERCGNRTLRSSWSSGARC